MTPHAMMASSAVGEGSVLSDTNSHCDSPGQRLVGGGCTCRVVPSKHDTLKQCCLRRWHNIKTSLFQRVVFAGLLPMPYMP